MTNPPNRPQITISWTGGSRFEATARNHRLVIDQPYDEGGTDEGVTPIEALAVSLGACVGYFVTRFCSRHDVWPEGLAVTVWWDYAEGPHRVGALEVAIAYRGDLDDALRDRLLKVAEGCTVHQTLAFPPDIRIRLMMADAAPTVGEGAG